jgi:hypothetical protein
MFYTREYRVEPAQEMTQREIEEVFHSFRDFLTSKGLQPLSYGEKTEPNRAAFRIGGSDAGFAFRRDWADTLELSYSANGGFKLRLSRIVHHPADFTEEYLIDFVAKTEKFIYEATSKKVHITLVPPSP